MVWFELGSRSNDAFFEQFRQMVQYFSVLLPLQLNIADFSLIPALLCKLVGILRNKEAKELLIVSIWATPV